MTSDADREILAGQLRALPLRELVDVLRRVLPGHTEVDGELRSILVLASATYAEGTRTRSPSSWRGPIA